MSCLRSASLALMIAVASVATVSQAAAETFVAISNTAMAITGDIEFDDFEIVFENGEKLVFDELVGDTFMVSGEEVGASVYSVRDPADPVLNNGNRLCGNGDVTYVAAWSAVFDDSLMVVAVFDTQDVPGSDADMCASYTYE